MATLSVFLMLVEVLVRSKLFFVAGVTEILGQELHKEKLIKMVSGNLQETQ